MYRKKKQTNGKRFCSLNQKQPKKNKAEKVNEFQNVLSEIKFVKYNILITNVDTHVIFLFIVSLDEKNKQWNLLSIQHHVNKWQNDLIKIVLLLSKNT